MQNARLSELEKVLAKTSSLPSSSNIKSQELSSSEEMNTLREENRVVRTDAERSRATRFISHVIYLTSLVPANANAAY